MIPSQPLMQASRQHASPSVSPVLGEAQRVAGQQQPAQQPLALAERQGPYVAAVGPQQVEHIQVHRYLSAQRIGDLGIGAGDQLLVTGHQPQLLAGPEHEAALAIELALEDPGRVGEPARGRPFTS
jgi:hypothetical protein